MQRPQAKKAAPLPRASSSLAAAWRTADAAPVLPPPARAPSAPSEEELHLAIDLTLARGELARARAQRDDLARGLARLSGRSFARELLVRCLIGWFFTSVATHESPSTP